MGYSHIHIYAVNEREILGLGIPSVLSSFSSNYVAHLPHLSLRRLLFFICTAILRQGAIYHDLRPH